MTGKEALESLFGFAVFETDCSLDQCKKCNDKLKHYCAAYRDYEIVEQDLEVLNIFKKYLFIKIIDKPSPDGTYPIHLYPIHLKTHLKENEEDDNFIDYTTIFVSKEEKNLLKEYFKNDK